MSQPARPPAAPALVAPDLHRPTVTILPWPDPLLDRFGHDPRSPYVDRFWLPIIGPSGTVLLRRLAQGFATSPEGYELDLTHAAQGLGMGRSDGPTASFWRTLDRVASFGFMRPVDAITLAVRPRLPTLTVRQRKRLPRVLRDDHDSWLAAQPGEEEIGTRMQHLAVSLLELGEKPPEVEEHLLRLHFHPKAVQQALHAVTADGEHPPAA
jgi:hypothetical protein